MSSKPEWKDITRWSRDETDRSEPRTWEIRSGNLRVCVTRLHRLEGWFMHSFALGINDAQLDSANIDDAKREAIDRVGQKISELSSAFDAMKHIAKPPKRRKPRKDSE